MQPVPLHYIKFDKNTSQCYVSSHAEVGPENCENLEQLPILTELFIFQVYTDSFAAVEISQILTLPL